jgi:hypothetical protein
MRTVFIRLIMILVILATAAACSTFDHYEASRPAKILEVEARLVKAGFRRVPIDTPQQDGAVAQLPLYRLNRYQSATGSVFWYADPTVSRCLYVGDQKAYENYAGLLQQEHDTAAYVNEVEPQQFAYLSPFGYAFPPPVYFGRWPATLPGSPIHSVGRGGGIYTHGHGGGPHGIGHGGGHGR